jgi:peptidoglycan/LPS O-acetylase OafA/YrhL
LSWSTAVSNKRPAQSRQGHRAAAAGIEGDMQYSSKSLHLEFLDGARGLAAAYVVLHHIWLTAYPKLATLRPCDLCRDAPIWTHGLLWGQLAVAIFIVVSGFSLALVPLRHGNRLNDGFRTYIARRAFRIIPPYWAALLLSCLVIIAVTGEYTGNTVDIKSVVVHALLVQNVIDSAKPNAAFWSIAVEWQIYFVMPLLLLLWRRWGGAAMVGLTSAVVVTTYLVGSHHGVLANASGLDATALAPLSKLLYLRPHFLALFAFGVAAAHAATMRSQLGRSLVPKAALCGAMLALLLLFAVPVDRVEANYFWIDLVVGGAFALSLASWSLRPSSAIAQWLSRPSLRWLGASSYSLYLIHVPVLELIYFVGIAPHVQSPGARFAAMLLLVLPCAVLSSRLFWHLFERPFMKHRSLRALLERRSTTA